MRSSAETGHFSIDKLLVRGAAKVGKTLNELGSIKDRLTGGTSPVIIASRSLFSYPTSEKEKAEREKRLEEIRAFLPLAQELAQKHRCDARMGVRRVPEDMERLPYLPRMADIDDLWIEVFPTEQYPRTRGFIASLREIGDELTQLDRSKYPHLPQKALNDFVFEAQANLQTDIIIRGKNIAIEQAPAE